MSYNLRDINPKQLTNKYLDIISILTRADQKPLCILKRFLIIIYKGLHK